MEKENPIFGRKVFFLYPSFLMEKHLLDFLKQSEYEVYKLIEYRKVRSLLSSNPNSMLFVNIDAELSYYEWYNFLKSFKNNPALESIQLGIVSEGVKTEDKGKFIANLELEGGFSIIENSTSSIQDFIEILEKNGARGRRKYIRLDTRNMRDVNGYLAHGDKLYSINIKDISSAGFAITYKQDIAPVFQKNARLTNLSITAGRKSQVCSCVVFNTMVNNDGTAMSVLLLASETPDSFRTFIRNYIFEKNNIALQNQLDAIKKDLTSYTDASEYKNLRSDVKAATNEEKPEDKKDE